MSPSLCRLSLSQRWLYVRVRAKVKGLEDNWWQCLTFCRIGVLCSIGKEWLMVVKLLIAINSSSAWVQYKREEGCQMCTITAIWVRWQCWCKFKVRQMTVVQQTGKEINIASNCRYEWVRQSLYTVLRLKKGVSRQFIRAKWYQGYGSWRSQPKVQRQCLLNKLPVQVSATNYN